MRTKNLSIKIKPNCKVPYQETYVVEYKSKDSIMIFKKFIDQTKNQIISLEFRECGNLLKFLEDFIERRK